MHKDHPEIELDWLSRWALYSPDKEALKCFDTGQRLTHKELYTLSLKMACVLRDDFDVQKGDRIAVLSVNRIEYVPLFFASQRLGAILIPLNYRLAAPEIDFQLSDAEPKCIIFEDEFAELIKETKYITKHKSVFSDFLASVSESREENEVFFNSTFEDACMILYTSGTTGRPKGALITPKMLFWNSINTGLRLNLTQDEVILTFAPFFHTGGWNVLTTPVLHRGGRVVLFKKFDPEEILIQSDKERATILFGVPTMMQLMADTEAFENVSLKSIRYAIVGGEPMPIDLIKIWSAKGVPIRQGYGLTEFGPNVFSLNEEDAIRKIGSVGFPNFYIDTRIVDDQGLDVNENEVGELLLKGPVATPGYWKNEKATKETIQDGWVYTGDLVKKDSEGYFYIVDRKKDMFISGAENVYPAEVEHAIRQHDVIKEAAVIGIPDEQWGEVGHAFYSTNNDQELSEQELKIFCLKHLAKFKVPKKFTWLNELPKSDSGKILKRSLNP